MMYTVYLVIGLINIFAKHNNYNIKSDNETMILRARRDLQASGKVFAMHNDGQNNNINDAGQRFKRSREKHYFYKNDTSQETKTVLSQYPNTPAQGNMNTNQNTVSYRNVNNLQNEPKNGFRNTGNITNDTYWNSYTGQPTYSSYNNAHNNEPTNNVYDDNTRSYGYNMNTSGPTYYNYSYNMHPNYNLPRYNNSYLGYNSYNPSYNGYSPFNNSNSTTLAVIPGTNTNEVTGIETTTPIISPACVICNVPCPAFMKRFGIFCLPDKQK